MYHPTGTPNKHYEEKKSTVDRPSLDFSMETVWKYIAIQRSFSPNIRPPVFDMKYLGARAEISKFDHTKCGTVPLGQVYQK